MKPVFGPTATSFKVRKEITPLVKYIGGKRKLAPQIVSRLPAVIEGTYFEPFAGAAAVFCELWNTGRIRGKAVLADHNSDLMSLYSKIRTGTEHLLNSLREYEEKYQRDNRSGAEALYYQEREEWNRGGKCAARFVFLKQTAFNGLWRVNQKGGMNAAWGKYETPLLVNEPNILAWYDALFDVRLFDGDTLAWNGLPEPKAVDVVYLDPPYVGTFDRYTDGGFTTEQQERLLALCADWTRKGATVAYSNSAEAEPLVRRIWPEAKVEFLTTTYSVNRDGAGRSGKVELLAIGGYNV
jgi:DNA adenine methylase